MVNTICELCKTGTSSKWRTITLNVAQDVLDVFDIQLSVGKLIVMPARSTFAKKRRKMNQTEVKMRDPLYLPEVKSMLRRQIY